MGAGQSADLFLELPEAKQNLDAYIMHHLQPNTEFNYQIGADVDKLVQFLHHDVHLSVDRVVKGGSLGKGTAIRGDADIDLVVFINDFKDMQDFERKLLGVLDKIKHAWTWKTSALGYLVEIFVDSFKINLLRSNHFRFSVQLQVSSAGSKENVDVDILPAFDNLAMGHAHTFQQMKREPRKYYSYSASLTELQIQFVKDKPAKLKNLIRLVKKWKNTYLEGTGWPTSYVFELMTIYAWEKQGGGNQFDTRKMFRNVLVMLVKNQELYIVWDTYYRFAEFRQHVDTRKRPFILDPANPFNNVCGRVSAGTWSSLADKAKEALRSTLLVDLNDESCTVS